MEYRGYEIREVPTEDGDFFVCEDDALLGEFITKSLSSRSETEMKDWVDYFIERRADLIEEKKLNDLAIEEYYESERKKGYRSL
jgi:hypothetical protein